MLGPQNCTVASVNCCAEGCHNMPPPPLGEEESMAQCRQKQTRGGGLASGRLQHVAVILNDKNSD